MNKLRSVPMVTAFTAAFLLATAPLSSAEKSTVDDIQEEIAKTTETLKGYANEQKDEAVETAETTLETLDAKIKEMQTILDRKWGSMSEGARKEAREAQAALREKRRTVAEWYGAMKHGSADTWQEVRNGFIKAYDSLGKSLGEAADSLNSKKSSTK